MRLMTIVFSLRTVLSCNEPGHRKANAIRIRLGRTTASKYFSQAEKEVS